MTKQEWARARNMMKGSLTGMATRLRQIYNSEILTETERQNVGDALEYVERALENWNSRNQLSKKKNCSAC
jgi:CRISPR/Cas system-associated exonuclease Cas4 (RecB family)